MCRTGRGGNAEERNRAGDNGNLIGIVASTGAIGRDDDLAGAASALSHLLMLKLLMTRS